MASRTRAARYAHRRQKRMARNEHDLGAEQWAAPCNAWGGCAYFATADGSFHKDTVLAISRGGRYALDNVAPARRSCNTSNCNDEVTGWMRPKKLDEQTFLARRYEISRALANPQTRDTR